MDDLLRDFLTETAESLSVLDQELVKLEQNPEDPKLLSSIFRIVHTIKGTCGFLGLPRLEAVAHASENVLGKVRDGKLAVTPQAISLILESLDQIKAILGALEQTQAEPPGDDADLIGRLNAMAQGGGALPDGASRLQTPASVAMPVPPPSIPEPVAPPPVTEAPTAPVRAAVPVPPTAPAVRAATNSTESKMAAEASAEAKESSIAGQSIRVSVDVLENLMTMVSELVLTRNQLLQILRTQKSTDFAAPLQRLNQVASELQEGVMKTRMQPIGNAWSKLPRLVRDLSHDLGKKIDLQMFGADTELDRQVLELIKDPLTHLVRNCADHGIEMPADRVKAAKPESGTIRLDARHEGGHIVIEIADDGRGLMLDRIRAKALENKLATEAELDALSGQQIMQFIFRAGFSTAAKVTAVSGRGVGMDVVRTNIEKIGGTVELSSKQGNGTTFIIKIPLTLAIVSALVVECAKERFAVPQLNVLELVHGGMGDGTQIERINNVPFLRLRNRLLPVVSLRNLLQLGDQPDETMGRGFIVVTQVGNHTFGMLVDRVFDTEEIVVKPVAPILRDLKMFSGNTILGDGSVIMILDPTGIADSSGISSQATAETSGRAIPSEARATPEAEEKAALLVFRAGGATPKVVPLSVVARLEEVDAKTIEFVDGRPVLQYRGRLMPLVGMEGTGNVKREGRQSILVFADGDNTMGLLVDEIVDIVDDRLHIQMSATKPGIVGSAVVAGTAMDVLDTAHYLTAAVPSWFDRAGQDSAPGAAKRRPSVLVVDDSKFFIKIVSPFLMSQGYLVTSVQSARRALTLLEAGRSYDAIITDIEMPEVSGFEFAQQLKASERWRTIPVIALSALHGPEVVARGKAAGIDAYVKKLDTKALVAALATTLNVQEEAA